MKYIMFSLLSALLLGCSVSLPKSWEEVRCKGKVQQGHYFDRCGLFSVELPKSCLDLSINEHISTERSAEIVFYHMTGYLQVVVEHMDSLALHTKLDGKALERAFDLLVYQKYVEISPRLSLLCEEVGEDTYFAIYRLPEAGGTINLATKIRDDAIRAVLLFQEEDLLVALATDENYFVSIVNRDDPEKSFQSLKEQLTKIRQSFKRTH